METKILNAVASLLSSNVNGAIDWDRSLAQIRSAVEAELAAVAEQDRRFESAIDPIFDALPPGKGAPTPTVVQTVAAALSGGNFAEHLRLVKELKAYLERSTRYDSRRGKSGGLFRV